MYTNMYMQSHACMISLHPRHVIKNSDHAIFAQNDNFSRAIFNSNRATWKPAYKYTGHTIMAVYIWMALANIEIFVSLLIMNKCSIYA